MSNPTFWTVWSLDVSTPPSTHSHFRNAEAEAEQLAGLHTGSEFFVMMAQSSFSVPKMQVKTLKPTPEQEQEMALPF